MSAISVDLLRSVTINASPSVSPSPSFPSSSPSVFPSVSPSSSFPSSPRYATDLPLIQLEAGDISVRGQHYIKWLIRDKYKNSRAGLFSGLYYGGQLIN